MFKKNFNAIFVISGVLASFLKVFIKFLWHCQKLTKVNATFSIISGGRGLNWTNRLSETWYYNHETEEFTTGPELLEGRTKHGSGTIVDKETKEKIPVVTGGYQKVAMNSTELLKNGQWQKGDIHSIYIRTQGMR